MLTAAARVASAYLQLLLLDPSLTSSFSLLRPNLATAHHDCGATRLASHDNASKEVLVSKLQRRALTATPEAGAGFASV